MIITVSVQVPMAVGDILHTPFGDKTITQADVDSGWYNKTISASRSVISTQDPGAIANHGADLVASLAVQS